MIHLSKRLQTVAGLIAYNTMADIGTDHGYLPLWLWEHQKIKKAIACDVNIGPLERGAANIAAAGAPIETRLGSGLSPLKPGEVETVVLAGMGGMLMVELLQDALPVVKTLKQLVLQPQKDIPQVRRALHAMGFVIEKEQMLFEDGHYYTVMSALPGVEAYTEREYAYGKRLLDEKDPVLKAYLEVRISKQEEILHRLTPEKQAPFLTELQEMKEVWSCL